MDYSEYFRADSDLAAFYKEQLAYQPYLAPEQILKSPGDLNAYVDIWGFGSMMYHILFGKPPKSFY